MKSTGCQMAVLMYFLIPLVLKFDGDAAGAIVLAPGEEPLRADCGRAS